MRFSVVTIFPEMFESVLGASLLGRARAAGLIRVDFVNPRDFTRDRHRSVDDTPYGGGPGMVMKVEPLVTAIESIAADAAPPAPPAPGAVEVGASAPAAASAAGEPRRPHRILLTPSGAPLTQRRVRELADLHHLVLVCGRYEGFDERISELAIDEELSIGDYVLTGGELGAMTIIDAVSRFVPGVLGEAASTEEETFSVDLLEYPQYTRPAGFRGLEVPEVLQSGNHERIRRWRRARSLERTAQRRPELFARHRFTPEDRALWDEMPALDVARRAYVALVHHPVHDRTGRVVTTAVTNFDVHDIARSSATYGLAGYFLTTPVAAQREKVQRILDSWAEAEERAEVDHRLDALSLVEAVPSLEAVLDAVGARAGARPRLVLTTADAGRFPGLPRVAEGDLLRAAQAEPERPLVLAFGTGWGLTDEVKALADQVLEPLCGRPPFNHLSVRSAVAAILDRLFGLRPAPR